MNDKLIYNQNSIPKEELRYGFRSSAATGCGWIATYNALTLMGFNVTPEKLISYYEKAFPLVNGNFGTFVLSPVFLLKRLGLKVKVTDNIKEFDSLAQRAEVCILFYHWRNKLKFGAHYIAVEQKDGDFFGYNTYKGSEHADYLGNSLEDFIKKRRYFGAILIAVKRKER